MRAALSVWNRVWLGVVSERVVVWLRMIRYLSIAVLLATVAAGSVAQAPDGETIPGAKVRILTPTQEPASQFSRQGGMPLNVEIRSTEAMGQSDKDLAASAAHAIRQRAEIQGLGLDEGVWKQSQIDCPAFPEHLLLRFTRDNGAGDLSVFTASVPRGKEGRVRLVPILRRGYAMYSPAAGNKITMAVFNQIRAEEQAKGKAEWAAIGLCYAALAGSDEGFGEPRGTIVLKPVDPPVLHLEGNGNETVELELGELKVSTWEMTFDGKGMLIAATQSESQPLHGRPIPQVGDAPKGTPLPTETEPQGRPIPDRPENQGRPVPVAPPDGGPGKPQ